jgi:hypothetical protein
MMTTRFEGFEMAKEIVEDPELRHIPVFMQTSIDVLTTTKDSVQEMVHEYRMMPGYSELDVLLLKNIATGETGVDYMNEKRGKHLVSGERISEKTRRFRGAQPRSQPGTAVPLTAISRRQTAISKPALWTKSKMYSSSTLKPAATT